MEFKVCGDAKQKLNNYSENLSAYLIKMWNCFFFRKSICQDYISNFVLTVFLCKKFALVMPSSVT